MRSILPCGAITSILESKIKDNSSNNNKRRLLLYIVMFYVPYRQSLFLVHLHSQLHTYIVYRKIQYLNRNTAVLNMLTVQYAVGSNETSYKELINHISLIKAGPARNSISTNTEKREEENGKSHRSSWHVDNPQCFKPAKYSIQTTTTIPTINGWDR